MFPGSYSLTDKIPKKEAVGVKKKKNPVCMSGENVKAYPSGIFTGPRNPTSNQEHGMTAREWATGARRPGPLFTNISHKQIFK